MDKVIKEQFVVVGKEGSTLDGEGFIPKRLQCKFLVLEFYHPHLQDNEHRMV